MTLPELDPRRRILPHNESVVAANASVLRTRDHSIVAVRILNAWTWTIVSARDSHTKSRERGKVSLHDPALLPHQDEGQCRRFGTRETARFLKRISTACAKARAITFIRRGTPRTERLWRLRRHLVSKRTRGLKEVPILRIYRRPRLRRGWHCRSAVDNDRVHRGRSRLNGCAVSGCRDQSLRSLAPAKPAPAD